MTVPTASGEPVRICCELHTPWTQLLGTPGATGSSAAQQQASCHPDSSVGGGAAPLAAAAHAAGSTAGGRFSPSGHADAAAGPTAEASDAAQAARGVDGGSQGHEPPHSDWGGQKRQPQQQEQRQGARINDPRRQKLLIVASLGVEGGSGWFSHVAAHFAGLRDPATGQPAADVVTFDNRWATWIESGSHLGWDAMLPERLCNIQLRRLTVSEAMLLQPACQLRSNVPDQ